MRSTRLGAWLKSGIAVMPLLLAAMPAFAQGDTGSIEVITVTARKTAESIQKVPESIQALSSQDLTNSHVSRIDDLGNLVSNLNITTRADQTPDVVLRGVGSFGTTQGVGFYVDDVQLFDGQTVRIEDLQRVEVLKGPQGTLYGGSNIGGAIKYITRRPTDELEGSLTAEYGAYNTQNISGFISGPLVGDHFKGRLSFYNTHTNGYQYNETLGRKVDRGNVRGGRLTFEYDNGPTTVTLRLAGDLNHSGTANLYYNPKSTTDYTYHVLSGTPPSYSRGLFSVALDVQHNFANGLVLNSITSYFHSSSTVTTDVDKGPKPFLTGHQNFLRNVWSQELRLSNSGDGPFTWITGLYAQGNDPNLHSDSVAFVGGKPSPANLANPALYASTITDARQRHREYAAYADGRYKLDKLIFELGLRADFNRSVMTDPFNGLRLSTHGTKILPKFSVSYQFNDSDMGYVTVSRGFEPGGLDEGFDLAGKAVLSRYKPETTWNYEAGFKSTFGNVRFNAAAFYADYANRLFQTVKFQGAQFVQVNQNIGGSRNYGFELEASTYLTDNLFLTANFGVTKAKWKSINFFDLNVNAFTNLKGLTAPYTPSYQGSVSADWTHDLFDGIVFGAHLDASFFGQHYWDVTDHYKQKAYQLVNVGVRLQKDNVILAGHVSNLFNARYLTAFASAASIQAPRNVGGIGRPKLWSISLTYKY